MRIGKLWLIAVIAVLITGCGSKGAPDGSGTTPSNSTLQGEARAVQADPDANRTPVACFPEYSVHQEPVDTARYDAYQKAATKCYSVYVPKDWKIASTEDGSGMTFAEGDRQIGNTETIAWFDKSTWPNYRPNHAEEKEFAEITPPAIEGLNAKAYRIKLVQGGPAAGDGSTANRTFLYIAVKELDRAYGFYFDSGSVDDQTLDMIAASFRFNS